MFNIKKLVMNKVVLSSKSIEISNEDSELMEICHKIASLKKGVVVTNEEFKKAQIQSEFKEIMTLFVRSVYKKDYKEITELFEMIDSKFNDLGSKKVIEIVEIVEEIIVEEKVEIVIVKEEIKEIKSDIEEMEETFKLTKRTTGKGKK